MPNLFSNLRECLGFSHNMKSTLFRTSVARKLISPRLPIGVDMIYRPFFKLFILYILTIIISCSPQNNIVNNILKTQKKAEDEKNLILSETKTTQEQISTTEQKTLPFSTNIILNQVEVLLPQFANLEITNDFINALELALYEKKIKNIDININRYADKKELNNIVLQKAIPGKIFVGPLTTTDTEGLIDFCSKGVIFFSFASNRKTAGECIYLINFFPEDELNTLFSDFKKNSKVALLYPENDYGILINNIIDPIANKSKSILISRASYKEDLTDAREAIKKLSKYESRKNELERQKNILKLKDDEDSKKTLKKLEKFETLGMVDFSHIIIPDYGIRLLQIAPLLPFYDIDPNKVQFVGTGVWDDEAFFSEPSLQGAIFPGVLKKKRLQFIENFYSNYKRNPSRTITIPYDLIGIIEYVINNNLNVKELHLLLGDKATTFDGIDGKFTFKSNIISRELRVLKINNGNANLSKIF